MGLIGEVGGVDVGGVGVGAGLSPVLDVWVVPQADGGFGGEFVVACVAGDPDGVVVIIFVFVLSVGGVSGDVDGVFGGG